jgi:regulatory protein
VEGEFAVGISEETLLNFGLRTDDEITKETLAELIEYDEYIYAKKCALDFLSYRIRSTAEIKDKLRTKNISAGTSERVIKHLQKLGLIDDEEFARQLVQSYISEKPLGKKVIMQKLFQKGISKQVGEKVLDNIFDSLNEKELALTNFKKYFIKLRDKDINKKKKKVFEFLARKGFSFDVINEIINENIS